jgi:hypothetical protein
MKSQLNWNNSQNLDSRTSQSLQAQGRHLSAKLNDIWQHALSYFYVSTEPRVWRTEDSLGRTAWSAYDPTTGRSIEHVSVQDLRVWLEERHYQSV